jgi:hypothetical protein
MPENGNPERVYLMVGPERINRSGEVFSKREPGHRAAAFAAAMSTGVVEKNSESSRVETLCQREKSGGVGGPAVAENNSRLEVGAPLDWDEPPSQPPLSRIEDLLPERKLIVIGGFFWLAPPRSAEMPGDQPGEANDCGSKRCYGDESY